LRHNTGRLGIRRPHPISAKRNTTVAVTHFDDNMTRNSKTGTPLAGPGREATPRHGSTPGSGNPPGGPGGGDRDDGRDGDGRTGIVTKTRPKTKKPNLYKVLLLNDDYTPMEFVVHVLERYFNKSREDANRIMLHVHQKGVGICGVFTYEVAETKVTQVMDFSRKHSHPLQCTMEKE
jgi:ATP-dependent Clp protease adaptor protein ClpS